MIHVSQDIIGSITDPITKEIAHVYRFTMVNDQTQMYVQVISYGATIYSLRVADAGGKVEDVVLGFDLVEEYQDPQNPYFGATIGRVCNRIANGSFFIYDKHVKVTKNHGNNHLHGGKIGFDKVPWDLKEVHADGVTFTHRSLDGHEGYPGEVYATVRYTLTEDNSLRIHMTAKATMTTVVNMTNHSYFNLAGHNAGKKALYEHNVTIFAEDITETDKDSIPTGVYTPVVCTPYDFRNGENLGKRIQEIQPDKLGFDDNFCVPRLDLDDKYVVPVARVIHPPSGRWMEVSSNQPGIQFYTSNYLPDEDKGEKPILGKNNAGYFKHGAFCLETQMYPDAPNHTNFPPILLRPGQTYEHIVTYKFGTCQKKSPVSMPGDPDAIQVEEGASGGP